MKMFSLPIPNELKLAFERDKDKLKEGTSKSAEEDILQYLNCNDALSLYRKIGEITKFSSYGYVKKEGFFSDYCGWFVFAIKQLMIYLNVDLLAGNGLDEDIYLALRCSQNELVHSMCIPKYDICPSDDEIDEIIDFAFYMTKKQREGRGFNPKTKQICEFFIKVGLGKTDITDVDISYDSFIREQAKSMGQGFTR